MAPNPIIKWKMAIPIIVAQVKEVLSGTYSSTAFIDTSSSICQSLLQDAVAASNAISLSDRLDTLISSGLISLLLDLFRIDLKPINETTVRFKCLALGTMTQLLKGISSGESTSYVRVQTSLLKSFVALGGMEDLAKAMSEPRAGNTQLTNYAVQFLRHFVQVRFGIVCLFRETYESASLLTTYLHTCTGNQDALNEMLEILALYTTTSFSTDEFLLFLSTRVPDFLFERVLSPPTQCSVPVSTSTRLATLGLLGDLLERLHTFKQSTAKAILTAGGQADKAMTQYNALLRHQDKVFARLVMDDYLVTNLLGGGDTRMLLSAFTKSPFSLHLSTDTSRTMAGDSSILYQPDIITVRLLSLFFLHCGERRIEAYTRVPFSILESRGPLQNRLPLFSVQEEQEVIDYLSVVYSVRMFRSLASFFYFYLDTKSAGLESCNSTPMNGYNEIVGAYLRIMLLFLVYSPSFFRQTLIDAALLEYNALQFEASNTQTMKLSSSSGLPGRRKTLMATFFIPLVQNIITPITYFPTIPIYAAATFGIFCIAVGNTLDYSNFQSLLQIVAEYVASDTAPLEEVILTKLTNCFMSNSLDFLRDVYIFIDIKPSPSGILPEGTSTVPRPISSDIILLSSGYNAMCTALYAAQCAHEDPAMGLGHSTSLKAKTTASSSLAQSQRISRMNANLLALYSSSASLKLFATDRELSLVSARTYLTFLDCLVNLFEVTDQYPEDTHYKLMQEYETYVAPNTIYSLYRRQDVLLLLQSINSPNVTLLCRNTREFLITHVVLLLHDIRSNIESLNVSTVTDAISRYIIDLSEALDLELMTSASRGQTDFTSLCAIDKLTFCRALLIILCDPYILLATGDNNALSKVFYEIDQCDSTLKITIDDTIQQLNSLLAHEILLKSVHSFCDFYVTNQTSKLVDLPHNLLVNIANDVRRLREIDNLKRVHGTPATDTGLLKTTGSFAQHFDSMIGTGLVPLEMNFASLMMQLCDRYGSSLVTIASQSASLAETQKRGTDLLRYALIIARSLDSDLTSANSKSETCTSQSYSILSTSTSLAQVSRLHSNKIKCKLISHMLQADKLSDGIGMVFMGKRDTLSYKGFGINAAYCLRYAHNTCEKTAMQQVQMAHTKNPTVFMVSSKFSQIQTLKADFGISLPSFRLQLADLLEITAWILEVIKCDYNVRVPEILYSPDLTETGAIPFSSAFVTELFPSYMTNTLELAIQATLKAREDNDRTLRFIDNTKDDSDSILHIIHRKVAIKICESILESLYRLRLMFFGLLGSKILFNPETSTFDTDYERFPEKNGYTGVYTKDTEGGRAVSAIPYKGKLTAYYFSETNAEVSRMSSVALVALMLTLMQPRRGAGMLAETSLTGFNSCSSPIQHPSPGSATEKDYEINMEAINLSPLQTVAFTEMLQESLRYGFVMDNNLRYLQVNVKFENIILGNAESNLSINAYIPRVRAFLRKYGNYSFAVPTVAGTEQEVAVRSSLVDDVFTAGRFSDTYVSTKVKENIGVDNPDHYRHSSKILKALREENEGQSRFSETSGETSSQFGRIPEKHSPSLITSHQQAPSRLISALLNAPKSESNASTYETAEDEFFTRQSHISSAYNIKAESQERHEDDAFKLDEIINADIISKHEVHSEDSVEPHNSSSRTSEAGSTPVPCATPTAVVDEATVEGAKTHLSDRKSHRASSVSGPGGIPKSIATIKKRAIPPPPPAAKSPPSKRSTFIERISASLAERQAPNTSVTPELSSYKDNLSTSSASEGSETPVIIQISKGSHETSKLGALNKDVSHIDGSPDIRVSENAMRPIEFCSAMSGVDTNTLVALMDSLSLDVKQVIEKHHASKESSPIMKGGYEERLEKEITPVPCALSNETLDSIITSLENIPKLGPPPSFT
ncbi:Hypothetical protein GLP15_3152 [Giardia lamblia P15]|uniref:Uncharacterized protein n=1 Tax=Giardia intestinalis (strain P15) TaxID=658858 RepID=E1F7J9_GIAIA|nr:Hypothetical protein GLP15_3152 [Giardia lamblia P15]